MARVWITDGSVPVFSDTRRLRASHKGPFVFPVRFEGFVDPDVPRGSATIAGERPDDVLFVEAEWCVEFPEGIDRYLVDPELLADSTPVVLQGLIEGKWMNRLLGTTAWIPASIGNNVLANGPGLETTIGRLDGVGGAARIDYSAQAGTQTYETTPADLRGHNIPDLVRDVLRACREDGVEIDAVDLGAVGERSATVNERSRMKRALRGDRVPLPNPLNIVPHRAKERLVRAAIVEPISVPRETIVTLTTSDGRGTEVGRATLLWR
jgi:hypothetical protein